MTLYKTLLQNNLIEKSTLDRLYKGFYDHKLEDESLYDYCLRMDEPYADRILKAYEIKYPTKFKSGKYAGKTFKEVPREYLEGLLNWNGLNDYLRRKISDFLEITI